MKNRYLKLAIEILLIVIFIVVAIFITLLCNQSKLVFYLSQSLKLYGELKNNKSFREMIIEGDDTEYTGFLKINVKEENAPLIIFLPGNN